MAALAHVAILVSDKYRINLMPKRPLETVLVPPFWGFHRSGGSNYSDNTLKHVHIYPSGGLFRWRNTSLPSPATGWLRFTLWGLNTVCPRYRVVSITYRNLPEGVWFSRSGGFGVYVRVGVFVEQVHLQKDTFALPSRRFPNLVPLDGYSHDWTFQVVFRFTLWRVWHGRPR